MRRVRASDRRPAAGASSERPRWRTFRESLSKHYYNYAQVLRALDRPADAAAAALARRELWPEHGTRLLRIAEELAAMCKQLEPGEIAPAVPRRDAGHAAGGAWAPGLETVPDLTASPFDVLTSLQPRVRAEQ